MFFIGSTDHRGTYYFYSKQHNGWIVADLDSGKASLHNRLAIILDHDDLEEIDRALTKRLGLGQDGKRWLIDGEQLVPLLRKHGEDAMEVAAVYYEDGEIRPYGKREKEIAKFARKIRKEKGEPE